MEEGAQGAREVQVFVEYALVFGSFDLVGEVY